MKRRSHPTEAQMARMKPSTFIRLAVEDLKWADRSKKYKVDMNYFHAPNSHCSVCFAGGVIARIRQTPDEFLEPSHFPRIERRLFALDCLRLSWFTDFLRYYDLPESWGSEFTFFPYFSKDKRAFYKGIANVIKVLESHGK